MQVRELSLLGGSDSAHATRRVLQTLFSTVLAVQYNWTGHGHKKKALRDLRLTSVIHCE